MEQFVRRLPEPEVKHYVPTPKGVIVLCGEDSGAVPNDIWDGLIDLEECPDLKIVEITQCFNPPVVRPREGVWIRDTMFYLYSKWRSSYGSISCNGGRYCREGCVCNPYPTFDRYVGIFNLPVEGIERIKPSNTCCTIVVYHKEEWAKAQLEPICRLGTRVRIYQYRGPDDIVRRHDLESVKQ